MRCPRRRTPTPLGRLDPSHPKSRPGPDLHWDGWDGWDGYPRPNRNTPTGTPSERPAESHVDTSTHGITHACPESWLYGALGGPFYANLRPTRQHPHRKANHARKARRNAMDTLHATASTNHGETAMPSPNAPVVLTIEQAANRLGIGRTTMYALVTAGQVRSVTIGRLRRIPAQCLDEYVARLLADSTDLPAAA